MLKSFSKLLGSIVVMFVTIVFISFLSVNILTFVLTDKYVDTMLYTGVLCIATIFLKFILDKIVIDVKR